MNFGSAFASAVTAKESGSKLSAGIHNCTFKSLAKDTITTQDGRDLNVLALTVDIENYGEFKTNFFEPTDDTRKDGMYGPQPSQLDNFMIIIRQILAAVNPKYADDVANGTLKIGGTFAQVCKALVDYTSQYANTPTQIKLIPGKNGYNQVPGFPARITKNGELGIATRFIGDNLTLTSAEEKKIKAAAVAKPDTMPSIGGGVDLSDLSAGLGAEIGAAADMPADIDSMPF